jgi:hypothetical protein
VSRSSEIQREVGGKAGNLTLDKLDVMYEIRLGGCQWAEPWRLYLQVESARRLITTLGRGSVCCKRVSAWLKVLRRRSLSEASLGSVDREKERRTQVSEAAGEATLSHVQVVEFDGKAAGNLRSKSIGSIVGPTKERQNGHSFFAHNNC